MTALFITWILTSRSFKGKIIAVQSKVAFQTNEVKGEESCVLSALHKLQRPE